MSEGVRDENPDERQEKFLREHEARMGRVDEAIAGVRDEGPRRRWAIYVCDAPGCNLSEPDQHACPRVGCPRVRQPGRYSEVVEVVPRAERDQNEDAVRCVNEALGEDRARAAFVDDAVRAVVERVEAAEARVEEKDREISVKSQQRIDAAKRAKRRIVGLEARVEELEARLMENPPRSAVVCPQCGHKLGDVIDSLIRQRGKFKGQREQARRELGRAEVRVAELEGALQGLVARVEHEQFRGERPDGPDGFWMVPFRDETPELLDAHRALGAGLAHFACRVSR